MLVIRVGARIFALAALVTLGLLPGHVNAQTPEAGILSDTLLQHGSIALPDGESDSFYVIMVGEPIGSSVPIVVRNNTDAPVQLDKVLGTARDGSGNLALVGEVSTTVPYIIAPSQVGIASVYFGEEVGTGLTFEFETETSPVKPSPYARQDITVQEASVTDDQIIGIVHNQTGGDLKGPFTVLALCFAQDGSITTFSGSFAAKNDLAADETSPFSLTRYGDGACDNYLVGSTGYKP